MGNKAVINVYEKQQGILDKIVFHHPTIDNSPVYFSFSKVHYDPEKLADECSLEIKKRLTSDNYQQILKRYNIDPL